jgi:hypothetical protein
VIGVAAKQLREQPNETVGHLVQGTWLARAWARPVPGAAPQDSPNPHNAPDRLNPETQWNKNEDLTAGIKGPVMKHNPSRKQR